MDMFTFNITDASFYRRNDSYNSDLSYQLLVKKRRKYVSFFVLFHINFRYKIEIYYKILCLNCILTVMRKW